MSEGFGGPCCAHSHVSWRTKQIEGGLTTGWWECDSGCGMRFTTVPHAMSLPPAETRAAVNIAAWKCKHCGCIWRDNLDGTVSLFDVNQRSCRACEESTPDACAVHWIEMVPAETRAVLPESQVHQLDCCEYHQHSAPKCCSLNCWCRAESRAVLPERNMYGCLPCPKCGSKFRWPTQDRTIQCDDCGLVAAFSPDTDTAPSPEEK
jgi:hypothetical protein